MWRGVGIADRAALAGVTERNSDARDGRSGIRIASLNRQRKSQSIPRGAGLVVAARYRQCGQQPVRNHLGLCAYKYFPICHGGGDEVRGETKGVASSTCLRTIIKFC